MRSAGAWIGTCGLDQKPSARLPAVALEPTFPKGTRAQWGQSLPKAAAQLGTGCGSSLCPCLGGGGLGVWAHLNGGDFLRTQWG